MNETELRLLLSLLLTFFALVQGTPPPRTVDLRARDGMPLNATYFAADQASQLPELFVFSDPDEYPPTQDAMKLIVG
jgi:hypothetical protein